MLADNTIVIPAPTNGGLNNLPNETKMICCDVEIPSQIDGASSKKRKAPIEERVCISCNEKLSGWRAVCQCCPSCCRSNGCRASEHVMIRMLESIKPKCR